MIPKGERNSTFLSLFPAGQKANVNFSQSDDLTRGGATFKDPQSHWQKNGASHANYTPRNLGTCLCWSLLPSLTSE